MAGEGHCCSTLSLQGFQMETVITPKGRFHLCRYNDMKTLLYCSCSCSVTQSYPTLCNPKNYNHPGSSVHGISQARLLEQVAISSSRASSQPKDWTHVSCTSCIGRWIFFLNHWATWEALYCHESTNWYSIFRTEFHSMQKFEMHMLFLSNPLL